jgi:hypothetical protein
MAELWHERGVRYFYFVDEHLLPYEEAAAIEHLRLWREGLEVRGVGALGIGTMLRADRVTPAVARAFSELGLVRVFVGLELAGEEEGHRFGRRPPKERELSLLEDFAAAGVVTVSNLMLVHPYSTPETIARGIDLLERVPRGVFEATRMMVYHGTRLHRTMEQEGRLVGNPLRYGYTFSDERVERFAEIFTRLRAEAFWDYSVAFRTHDAFLALALARRVHAERVTPALFARVEAARARVNRLYVDAYRRALDLSLSGGGFAEAEPLVLALRPQVREVESQLDAIEAALSDVGAGRGRPFAPMRAAAASAVSFVLATGCGRDAVPEEHARPPGPVVTAVEAGAPPEPPRLVKDASVSDAELVAEEAGPVADSGPRVCSASEREEATRVAARLVSSSDACFAGRVELSEPPRASPLHLQSGFGPRICSAVPRSDASAVARALAGRGVACVDETGRPPTLDVRGKAQADLDAAAAAIGKCQVGAMSPKVKVTLDGAGRVLRVDGGARRQSSCLVAVLSGLRFPCLASFEVCPEHVIIE